VLVNTELGYAGTADLLVEHQQHGLTLVDYKTQGVKPGYKARAYGSWGQQLAAYRRAIGKADGLHERDRQLGGAECAG